jgi:hypothetical protein
MVNLEYGAKKRVNYCFYQYLAPNGAAFLRKYNCGYTVAKLRERCRAQQ